jgi:hypothetical protein
MADAPCRTRIDTDEHGTLPFQDWFVRHRAAPPVRRVWFEGDPPPAPAVIPAIEAADLVIIGPSNPYVSIDPILSLPGVRAALERRPVVAISPIIGGEAVKGPLAGMIRQLAGDTPSPAAIVRHYRGLLSGMVIEAGDEAALAGGEVALAGGEVALARGEVALAGGEVALAGDEAALAGDEVALAGDEAAPAGDEAALARGEAALAGPAAPSRRPGPLPFLATRTLMTRREDSLRLAREVLTFALELDP